MFTARVLVMQVRACSSPNNGAFRPCRKFINVIVLRNPVQRILSHLAYMQGKLGSSLRSFVQQSPILANEYYVRTLLGAQVYRLPLGRVTREDHCRGAHIALRRFDFVLALEHVDSHVCCHALNARRCGHHSDCNCVSNSACSLFFFLLLLSFPGSALVPHLRRP